MKFKCTKAKIITIPNILSLFRILLIPAIVYMYCREENYIMSGYLLILSGITDLADGFIARRFNLISDVGKVLDPIADKLTQSAMLICLISRFPLVLLPFILMVVKEIFMVISGGIVIKKTGLVLGANWHGKVATCLLYTMMILHTFWYNIPPHVSGICIVACSLMIIISFILYGIRNINEIKAYNKGR